jgi:hypothetical protein
MPPINQQQCERDENNAAPQSVRFEGRTFISDPTSGIYISETRWTSKKAKTCEDHPYPVRVSPDWWAICIPAILSFATVVLLLATVKVANRQWEEMVRAANGTVRSARAAWVNAETASDALEENRESFNETLRQMEAQTWAQAWSANAAFLAAHSAQGVLALQQKAQRPWLGIVGGKISANGLQTYAVDDKTQLVGVFFNEIAFDLQNFGISPATKVSTSLRIVFPPAKKLIIYGSNPPDSISKELCNWADSYTKPAKQYSFPSVQQVSISIMPTEKHPIAKDSVAGSDSFYDAGAIDFLWMVGCISYSDIAGNPHHTTFQAKSITQPQGGLQNVSKNSRHMWAPHFTGFEVVVETPD